ncbi:DUF7529 family protein [Haloparvum sedimenti]|uniref:DUF7529 family protein n=1 Tax=Haloparvum sedimenti TaxID=1678448 RepID=UPI00071E6E93|nr:hypothetical protein [Haloparvum sedimenti]
MTDDAADERGAAESAADAEAPTGSRDRFASLWDRVEADLEATAEEYREAGWDVTTLDVGDVTPLPSTRPNADRDRVGLDALVPGTQFDALRETVDDHAFDEYETYRAAAGDVTFLVLVMRDTDAGLAVMLPLFYVREEAEAWLEAAREDGETNTYVRPLTDDERVVFHHEDPEPFYPPEADAAEDADTGA